MKNFLIEADIIPEALLQQGLIRGFLYNGPSMLPTFRPGQVLYVRPEVKDINAGDILVFEQEGTRVVHRVILVETQGYHTRGDNNRQPDPGLVAHGQVLGRVEMVEHQGEVRKVLSGRRGLWRARLGWAFRRFEQPFRLVIGWPYRRLKTSELVSFIWKPQIQTIRLETEKGVLIKYIHDHKTVAVWDANQKHFTCRKPFDLIIQPPLTEINPS